MLTNLRKTTVNKLLINTLLKHVMLKSYRRGYSKFLAGALMSSVTNELIYSEDDKALSHYLPVSKTLLYVLPGSPWQQWPVSVGLHVEQKERKTNEAHCVLFPHSLLPSHPLCLPRFSFSLFFIIEATV